MKIELEEPFKSSWRNGYLRISNKNRRIVDLQNSNDCRTTISYARYLMCVKLGYILSSEFEVDHIDNDYTNDDIGNLQVLTSAQNKEKERLRYIQEEQIRHNFICPQCNSCFSLTDREVKGRLSVNKDCLFFCSQSCNGKHQTGNRIIGIAITSDVIAEINNLAKQNLSNYRISKMIGVTAPTVAKYRHF